MTGPPERKRMRYDIGYEEVERNSRPARQRSDHPADPDREDATLASATKNTRLHTEPTLCDSDGSTRALVKWNGGVESTALGLGQDTDAWVAQLFTLQRSHPKIEAFVILRNRLTEAREDLAIRFSTLLEVIKAHFTDNVVNRDPAWVAFRTIVKQSEDQRPKSTKGEQWRNRNLAIIGALWGPQIVREYGIDRFGQRPMLQTQRCATQCPDFSQFVPWANAALLTRQRNAVLSAKHNRISNDERLTEPDFKTACDFLWRRRAEELKVARQDYTAWTSSKDGDFKIGEKRLREWHPIVEPWLLGFDSFGILAPRSSSDPCKGIGALASRSSADAASRAALRPAPAKAPSSLDDGTLEPPDAAGSLLDAATAGLTKDDMAPTALLSSEGPNHAIEASSPPPPQSPVRSSRSSTLSDVPPTTVSTPQSSYPLSPKTAEELMGVILREDAARQNVSTAEEQSRPAPVSDKDGTIASDFSTAGTLTIWDDPVPDTGDLAIEEELHNKHCRELQEYCGHIHAQSGAHSDTRYSIRAKWFTQTTRWAQVWDSCRPHRAGVTQDSADVLYYSSDHFIRHASAGNVFNKPVVIRQESFADSPYQSVQSFASMLRDSHRGKMVEVQTMKSARTVSISVDKFLAAPKSTNSDDGYNALNIRDIAKAQRPLFLSLPRFRLLDMLVENARDAVGKDVQSNPIDVESCIAFNIFALRGAFSGAHRDALGGTWVRNLDGIKLWMIVPDRNVTDSTFKVSGDSWSPQGKERLILLEPDDVLLMPPGVSVVHAVHSPSPAVMAGGMLWDNLSVIQTLRLLHDVGQYQNTTNEAIAFQLADILDSLQALVEADTDRFCNGTPSQAFIVEFRSALERVRALGCDCAISENACCCLQASRRCTSLCHTHPRLPPQRVAKGEPQANKASPFLCMHEDATKDELSHCICKKRR